MGNELPEIFRFFLDFPAVTLTVSTITEDWQTSRSFQKEFKPAFMRATAKAQAACD